MSENVNGKKDRFNLSYAIKLIVIGLLMGTVFTVGGLDRVVPITREECSVVETRFVDYEIVLSSGRIEQAVIECADWKQYMIDGGLVTEELQNELSVLSSGEDIVLLLGPNSDKVLEFVTGEETLLAFEDAVEHQTGELTIGFWFGAAMYAFALCGLYRLIKILRRRNAS